MKTCKVEGCKGKYFSKGYCQKHYRRWFKYGDPLYSKIEMHGLSNTPEYIIWCGMKTRCYDKNHRLYHCYGGRGVIVCDRWLNSFIAFLKDIGNKPFKGAQIDRINNDGNYEPGNCQWVSCAENIRKASWVKLTMQKANEIRNRYKSGNITHRQLGILYGVHHSTINSLMNNQTWT